jgi:hypothetical protein
MKKILFCIIFYEYIYLSLSFVPLWNFDNSAIKLFPDPYNKRYKYTPCNKFIYHNIKMNDEIIIEYDGTIRYQNYMIYNKEKLPANYTDVESAYEITENEETFYYVCPKGKFHLHRYKYYDVFTIIKPDDFNEVDDWELKCYYHPDEHFLFVSYLKSKNDIYQYDLQNKKWKYNQPIYDGIYDFKWNVNRMSNDKKQMFAILKKGNQLSLNELHTDVYQGQYLNVFYKQKRILAELKSNYDAFFSDNKDDHHFYWINYNETYFSSGYYNGTEKITSENFNEITIVNNTDNSPLDFYEKISIKEMNFIPYTKYVYYKIYNEGKRKYYHGIIDIVQNKVIFNTDEQINNYYPLSNKAMYVSTDDNYYQICIIKNNSYIYEKNTESYDSYECVDKCSNGEILIYDTATVNRCGNKCNTNYILQPEDICINSCDENIYTINGDQCGYCKDIDPNGHKYKLVNNEGCLKEKPTNSYYINEKNKLIACKDGVEFKDGKCGDDEEKNCYKNCKECYGESTDPKAQKCTSCKQNFVLDGENCKCQDHYFEKDNKCEKCLDTCKSCESKEDNCTSCNNGEYLEKNECKKCHEDCNTCRKGVENDIQNCLSCNSGKYLYNYSCLEKCPENTTQKGYECIEMNNKKEEENIEENEPIMLTIFIIITAIFLVIIIICFFKKACSSNEDEEIVNQIYTELS